MSSQLSRPLHQPSAEGLSVDPDEFVVTNLIVYEGSVDVAHVDASAHSLEMVPHS